MTSNTTAIACGLRFRKPSVALNASVAFVTTTGSAMAGMANSAKPAVMSNDLIFMFGLYIYCGFSPVL